MKVIFYRDEHKEWRWRAVAKNGRVIADSGEGYKRKAMALKGWHKMLSETFEIVYEK